MDDNTFVSEMRAALKAQYDAHQRDKEREDSEREIIRAEAPVAWDNLKRWIVLAIHKIDHGLKMEDTPSRPNEFKITRPRNLASVAVTFQPANGVIRYAAAKNAQNEELLPVVQANLLRYFRMSNEDDVMDVPEMGQFLIKLAVHPVP